MRRRFFVERFENGRALLRGDAAHHLGRVLRAEPGQRYELSDGVSLWLAQTERVGCETIEFTLTEPLPVLAPPVRTSLFLAVVKFDRFEWALEKATELGADEVVPLAAERSEKGLIAASTKRAARWERILLESAQQSRCLRVPALGGIARPEEAFRATRAFLRLMLSERPGAQPFREILEPAVGGIPRGDPIRVAVAIGPEGGWTDTELGAGAAAGFTEVSLGNNILRTETAVCAGLAAILYVFGAWGHARQAAASQTESKAERR
jgi:16S rRNA (uracil1498-N3)-methyltransferase